MATAAGEKTKVCTIIIDRYHHKESDKECFFSHSLRHWLTKKSPLKYVFTSDPGSVTTSLLTRTYPQLKNDIELKGTLKSVDQYLNLKLDNISCSNESKYPHLSSVRNIFIRGSTVRYVYLNKSMVDTNLLQDAARREAMTERK